ncbi:MAG: shikimate dehydrogenase [Cyanobacteriota bacterium]
MAAVELPSVTGTTQLLAVLGDPVRHSLSPAMHNAALQRLGLDWVYLALPVSPTKLAVLVEALEAVGCRGLNVTIPHKQAVAALCQELSPLAERVGAVNTLVPITGGGWFGTNTDVEGFLAPLRDGGWQGRQALVLGCGGSARAVVAALVDLGLERIVVAARRPESLAAFAAGCSAWAPRLQTLAWSGDPAAAGSPLLAVLAEAALVVNTTPVGMASAGDPTAASRCPLNPWELDALAPGCRVYDLIYTPRPTRLLQEAAARGCSSVDGLEMLVRQGAAALRLWSGAADVPVAAMRAVALRQLGNAH